ncbi:MAG: RNA polymerase factor sigma-54 [Pyrinomonadaceae bacterium]
MSLKLTARLDQRMVLTPQLRQRIEMLQMTSLELNDLVQQEMLLNPVLEEVQSQDEVREISENIIDQMADGNPVETVEGKFSAEILNPDFAETSSLNGNGSELLNGSNGSLPEPASATNENFEDNFAGESSDSGESGETDWSEEPRSDTFEDIDYGREFQEYLDPGYRTQEIEHKEDAPSFEQFLTRQESLTEHLEWQLRLQPLAPDLVEIAVCIIGNLDGDGRLTASDEEIAAMCKCAPERVETAREIVMQLEPVGCGARHVRECLLVQLAAKGETDRLAKELIRDYLTELQPHKLGHLAKEIGCEIDDIKTELELIRTLDPYPGRRYATDAPVYIAPEIYIEKIEGEYVVYFADDGSPRLRLSSTYQQMLGRQQTSKEERDFIKEKIRSAVDLLRNIEHRRQTIYRVVECIVERQHEFLDKGVQFLRPMMLKDVAEETGMHLSTISRVVNRKYAHTTQGVIELRRFFSEGMLNEDGEEVSTRIIKLRIKKLIEEENQREPVTDDYLAKVLAKEGIKLSRRTVAKYRDQMRIAGSRERKVV